VTIHVASRSEVPVMVHRPLDTSIPVPQPRPVLIGIGPGSGCEPVVEFGFVEADLRGAPLLAIHVRSGAVDPGEIERMFDEALSAWSDKYPQVAVRRMVRYGLDVAVSLTAAARSAQLIVVGSSRRTRTGGLLAGSVGQALIRRASCPVAVLPAH
jgi:nucleotide-binding universal stress UspA family protein